MRPHEEARDFGVAGLGRGFDIGDRLLDPPRIEIIIEFEADRRHDLLRREMDGQHFVDRADARLRAGDRGDALAQRRPGALADQQPLALARQQSHDDSEHDADEKGAHAIIARIARPQGEADRAGGDDEPRQRGAILEQRQRASKDPCCGGRRAASRRRPTVCRNSRRAIVQEMPSNKKAAASTMKLMSGRTMGSGRADIDDALIDGRRRAAREDHQRDDEAPEIKLAAIAEGVEEIRGRCERCRP